MCPERSSAFHFNTRIIVLFAVLTCDEDHPSVRNSLLVLPYPHCCTDCAEGGVGSDVAASRWGGVFKSFLFEAGRTFDVFRYLPNWYIPLIIAVKYHTRISADQLGYSGYFLKARRTFTCSDLSLPGTVSSSLKNAILASQQISQAIGGTFKRRGGFFVFRSRPNWYRLIITEKCSTRTTADQSGCRRCFAGGADVLCVPIAPYPLDDTASLSL